MTQPPAKFNGPPDQGILIKQKGQNAVLSGVRPMPMKFYPSAGDSMFSNARRAYTKDAGGGKNFHPSSSYTELQRINAIGQSSTKQGLPVSLPLSFRSSDSTSRNNARIKVRSGGCVAPKKKGAIANPFKGSCSGKCQGGC